MFTEEWIKSGGVNTKPLTKLVVNSTNFLNALKKVDEICKLFVSVNIVNEKMYFGQLDFNVCVFARKDFQFPLYSQNIKKLIRHLEIFSDQPITLEFSDSEVFNIKICEAYI